MERSDKEGFIVLNEHERELLIRTYRAIGYEATAKNYERVELTELGPMAQDMFNDALKVYAGSEVTETPELLKISQYMDDYEDLRQQL